MEREFNPFGSIDATGEYIPADSEKDETKQKSPFVDANPEMAALEKDLERLRLEAESKNDDSLRIKYSKAKQKFMKLKGIE